MNPPRSITEAKKPSRRRRIWIGVILLIAIGGSLMAVAGHGGQRWFHHFKDERFLRALALKKETSLKERGDEMIAGERAVDYLADRTFFVIELGGLAITSDLDEVVFEFVPNASKRFPYGGFEVNDRSAQPNSNESGPSKKNLKDEKVSGQHGSAAAITSDGYFLTNAHVIESDDVPVYLWGPTKQGMKLQRARVVWRGDYGHFDLPDMVLLHAEMQPLGHFPLREGKALPPKGEVLFTSGYGGLTPGHSAGQIVVHGIERKWDGDVRWRALIHTAPILPGDSGGPVTSRSGELVGINARMHPDSHWSREGHEGFKARAIRPYGDWLKNLITEDRAARKANEPSE